MLYPIDFVAYIFNCAANKSFSAGICKSVKIPSAISKTFGANSLRLFASAFT